MRAPTQPTSPQKLLTSWCVCTGRRGEENDAIDENYTAALGGYDCEYLSMLQYFSKVRSQAKVFENQQHEK
jgi:hypothetical protein